ncbi:MAG: hypothetical protein Q8M62_15855 [Algoriphagus sp.]|uniref:hypothetical protein n=1 Tax=Algoriphagus sp. TaxID=1872435 RepID=UPI00273752AC|nr:hypothetical protein [Algoriphagus sp.]MDP3201309.1 hypothetical protein [Algoriphagus sp.]
MNKDYLPQSPPENWIITEIDEANEYLEFSGFNGEFLVSVMAHPEDNPSKPYFLSLSQLKGILHRYDFENLNWPEWHATPNDALKSAFDLMKWMNENYQSFIPLTLEVWVSLGSIDQLELIQKHFKDELVSQEFQGQQLIFKPLNLSWGSSSYSESAISTLCHFIENSSISPNNLTAGILTNERFQLIEDVRAEILIHLKPITHDSK